MSRLKTMMFAAAVGLGAACDAQAAAPDPVSELANAICAAGDAAAIDNAVATLAPPGDKTEDGVAEAFGVASFMADLGRCANGQAIADAYAAFKKGKSVDKLDAAFAMGRVSGAPNGGTASSAVYQSSFASLGSAGDPPSGQ